VTDFGQCNISSASRYTSLYRAAGASLHSGEMELMLHRRTLYDDRRGVAEPLNETACGCRDCACDGLIVRGTHLLTFEVRSLALRSSVENARSTVCWLVDCACDGLIVCGMRLLTFEVR